MNKTYLGSLDTELAGSGIAGPGEGELRQIGDMFLAVRRNIKWILLAGFVAGVLAYLFTYTMTVRYTSVSRVMIDTRIVTDTEYTPQFSALPTTLTSLESELEVLRSTDLVQRVVDNFRLTSDPEFNGEGGGGITLNPIVLLRQIKKSVFSGGGGGGSDRSAEDIQREETIQKVSETREIEQVGNTSAVYAIRFTSENPEKAAAVANALADEYLAAQTTAKRATLEQSHGWLSVRTNQLQDDLNDLSAKLEAHSIETPFSPEEYATIKAHRVTVERQSREIRETLEGIENQRETMHLLFEQGLFEEVIAILPPSVPTAGLSATDITAAELAPLVEQADAAFDAQEGPLRARLAELAITIAELREDQALQVQHDAAARRIEHEIVVTETIYQDFMAQLSRRTQQDEYLDADARIIERARPPIDPSEPQRTRTAGIFAILAGLLSVLGVMVFEIFQRRLRTNRDFEEHTGLQMAGIIPEAGKDLTPRTTFFNHGGQLDPTLLRSARKLRAIIEADLDKEADDRFSYAMKHGTGAKSGGKSAQSGTPLNSKIIAGASALPDEGQSTSLLVLGCAYAEADQRTIIVDCDLAQSPYAYLAGFSKEQLIKISENPEMVDQHILQTNAEGLHLLPAMVSRSSGGNQRATPQIQYSPAFGRILEHLSENYDRIILDTPPMLLGLDSVSLMGLADHVVMFARWNNTPRDAVVSVKRMLNEVGIAPTSAVATRVNLKNADKYGEFSFAVTSQGVAGNY